MPHLGNIKSYRRADTATLLEKAREVVSEELDRSIVLHAHADEQVPKFDAQELVLSKVLGRGGFCVVHHIQKVRLFRESIPDNVSEYSTNSRLTNISRASTNRSRKRFFLRGQGSGFLSKWSISNRKLYDCNVDVNSREYVARRVWAREGNYVLKAVEPELLHTDRITYLKGVVDLVMEAKYLASLSFHPHIMQLRGVSKTDPFLQTGYFIVLDELPEILSKRLYAWMHLHRATKGITGMVTRGRKKAKSLLVERLLVADDIAEAMDYIHSKGIVYRDLKPDNIGFDSEGTLKIFDFGLAKELREEDRDGDGMYRNMTKCCGAFRYMAPEVGLSNRYNQKADVYSWSMVFWYIMALEPPMGMYTTKMFIGKVFQRGDRPAVYPQWPSRLGRLMRSCWSDDVRRRPNFQKVMHTLKKSVRDLDPETASFMRYGGTAASAASGTAASASGASDSLGGSSSAPARGDAPPVIMVGRRSQKYR